MNPIITKDDKKKLSSFDLLVLESRKSDEERSQDEGQNGKTDNLSTDNEKELPFDIRRVPVKFAFIGIAFDLLAVAMFLVAYSTYLKKVIGEFWLYLVYALFLLGPGIFFTIYAIRVGFVKDVKRRETMLSLLPN